MCSVGFIGVSAVVGAWHPPCEMKVPWFQRFCFGWFCFDN